MVVPDGKVYNWKCNFDGIQRREALVVRRSEGGEVGRGSQLLAACERASKLSRTAFTRLVVEKQIGEGGEVARRPLGKVGFDLCRRARRPIYLYKLVHKI